MDSISEYLTFILKYGIFVKKQFRDIWKNKNTHTKGYGIFGVNYFGNGILGPPTPPYPTKTNLHDIPCQNTNRQTKHKHPLTIWHGRIESLALQIRCWVTTIGYLGSHLPSLSICAYKWRWCIQTFLHFDPLDVNINTRSVSHPVRVIPRFQIDDVMYKADNE